MQNVAMPISHYFGCVMERSVRASSRGTRWTAEDRDELALRIRLRAVRMVAPQGFGYLGQALSAAEQVATVFTTARPGIDRLVCSPGHYVIAPFAAAAEMGLLDEELVSAYGHNGSPARTYTLISDGEMEEGQVWEAAIFAGHFGLDRLIVLLDANNSQVDGPIDTITTIEPIAEKWAAFGWHAQDIDGHDTASLAEAIAAADAETARPSVVVCRTSTVHGLECLPSDADGHFIKLPPELAEAALAELTAKLEARHA